MQIEKRRNDKLYGSFTAVLNLTTDNAPTNPSEKANELFITVITRNTINPIIVRILLTCVFPPRLIEYFL